jgi:hypothetical protein
VSYCRLQALLLQGSSDRRQHFFRFLRDQYCAIARPKTLHDGLRDALIWLQGRSLATCRTRFIRRRRASIPALTLPAGPFPEMDLVAVRVFQKREVTGFAPSHAAFESRLHAAQDSRPPSLQAHRYPSQGRSRVWYLGPDTWLAPDVCSPIR